MLDVIQWKVLRLNKRVFKNDSLGLFPYYDSSIHDSEPTTSARAWPLGQGLLPQCNLLLTKSI